jgi:hypothetical protein
MPPYSPIADVLWSNGVENLFIPSLELPIQTIFTIECAPYFAIASLSTQDKL